MERTSTTEELQNLALRHGSQTADQRFAFSWQQLQYFASQMRSQAFSELHPFAIGPDEHWVIDAVPTTLVDSLADRSIAIPVPSHELVEAMGMDEASSETMRMARAVERAVWKNRLRVPDGL